MPKKEYDNTNRGTLFRNYDKERMKDEKDTSNWANSQGKINIYGVEFYISAWSNVIKSGDHKGDKMMSLQVSPVEEKEGEKLREACRQIVKGGNPAARNNVKNKKVDLDSEFDDMDDDLPF